MPPRLPVIPGTTADGRGSVHALVVGVGRYTGPGLPGLAAAAPAALAFADWLLREHAPPGLARGSIDVLASRADGAAVSWEGHPLDPPTIANVEAAADALVARADADPGSMIVFYFCGHGVQSGALRSLLLEDADLSSLADPFRNAIAFDDFVAGLAGCGPRRQLFVLDSCRELPLGLAKWADDVGLGRALVRCNKARRALLGPRTNVVLEAASETQKAWQGAQSAWFTDALLTVLKGAAGDNRFTSSADEYAVSTRDITEAIKFLVKGGFIDAPAGPQVPERNGNGGDFDLHLPPCPVVPVLVTRRPPSTNLGATFCAVHPPAADVVASYTCPGEAPWRSTLPVGDYVFQCNAAAVPTRVSVPAKRVELP